MPAVYRSLIIFSLLLLIAGRIFCNSSRSINVIEYELWNYIRHPRMEEEDYSRESVFEFQPGLEIITDLDDIKILLSGEEVGRTPWEQNNLEPGLYRVQLILKDFELSDFTVTVHNDRRTVIILTIGKLRGTLVLRNMPSDAEVEIDGESYTESEISVEAGKRRLRVSAFGWETSESAIEIPLGGSVEWRYNGRRKSFKLEELKIVPKSLPPTDRLGFKISWLASSSGTAKFEILSPNNELIAEMPITISAPRGSIHWLPAEEDGIALLEGTYKVVASGIGEDNIGSISTASLVIDSRFQREARLMLNTLPGLLYAPGTSILPKGLWQIATEIGANIDSENPNALSKFPVKVGIRVSPNSRWELGAKFGVGVRIPSDTVAIHSSLSGSWRINSTPGPFEINLALLFSHDGLASKFDRIPQRNFEMILPGLHLATPIEFSLDRWNLILTPSISLTFIGTDKDNWKLASPIRTLQSLSLGAYHENEKFLLGISTTLRGPDFPQGFVGFSLWSGLEARFNLLGEASYLAVFSGVRYLDINPVVKIGFEVGLIG